ncbi:energy-coupled thiamine transporter ThiT, partial [Streptococcus suis]
LATFLSGIIFYADYAPDGMPVWFYSFTYNISYILPSTAIASILLILLYRARPGFYNL